MAMKIFNQRNHLEVGSAALLGALLAAISPAAPIVWIDNPAEADRVRATEKKPSVLYFYNHTARPAMQMRTETLEDDSVKARLNEFVCVAINQQDYNDLAKEFKLVKVPTVVFLDSQGRELDRAVGFKPADAFVQYLDRITAAYESRTSTTATITPFLSSAVDISQPGPGRQPVTFQFFARNAESVAVIGDFNDWRHDANPLKPEGNGNWTLTAYLPNGVYEYLYLLDGQTHRTDPRNLMRKVNPYGGSNSVLLLGEQKTSPLVQGNSVFFLLYNAQANDIKVAGTFNNWEQFTMYRNPREPGMWGVRYDGLTPGTYQYKFIIDGEWTTDPENYTPMPDMDGILNSSFTIR
jgi:thiol-disulfide isomerase/thioredoxin